jgi:hypothetical protein
MKGLYKIVGDQMFEYSCSWGWMEASLIAKREVLEELARKGCEKEGERFARASIASDNGSEKIVVLYDF